MRRRARVFAVLPTLLTLGNAVCGFGAITLAAGGADPGSSLFAAAGLIFLAMVCDTLDGSAARWADRVTPFGAQLDSLCDAISFGAAPALLMFRFSVPHGYPPRLLWVVAALYVTCTVLRLARFNVRADDRGPPGSFRGLPSPAAAGTVASFPVMVYGLGHLAYPDRHPAWDGIAGWLGAAAGRVLPAVTLAVACLMVSSVRYAHVVRHLVRGRRTGRHVIKLVFAVAVISVLPELSALLLFGWYTFATPIGAGWKQCVRRLNARERPVSG
jgi:CDP-diacylglycerol--serine O-phosphatidyltransferase